MRGIEHCNWFILVLLLTALTISFLLNCTSGRNDVISRIGNYASYATPWDAGILGRFIKDNLVKEKTVSLTFVRQMTISSYRRNIKASLPLLFLPFLLDTGAKSLPIFIIAAFQMSAPIWTAPTTICHQINRRTPCSQEDDPACKRLWETSKVPTCRGVMGHPSGKHRTSSIRVIHL